MGAILKVLGSKLAQILLPIVIQELHDLIHKEAQKLDEQPKTE